MPSSEFKGPTPKQLELSKLLASDATHIAAFGGSSSGKTFWFGRAVAMRAIRAPGSRHAILRHRFNHVVTSVWYDTWPRMMSLCFPEIVTTPNKQAWFIEFPNKSQVWFGGLDEKERAEKILGQGHATIYLNECSQIAYSSVEIAKTRMRQKVANFDGTDLRLRMYYDCNPPLTTHWMHRLFVEKVDPVERRPLAHPENYVSLLMNPRDNLANLPSETIKELESLSPRQRLRFLEGKWGSAAENALWTYETIEKYRVVNHPDLQRIIVSVDPSGTSGDEDDRSDEVGVVVVGLGVDGHAYVLEDVTLKAPPAVWGRVVVTTYQRHEADAIVGEINYGGAMVAHVIRSAASSSNIPVNFKEVTASRGKVVRAEPISALYEQGKVHHVGAHPELEDQLCAMTTAGYMGDRSPDRADALVWGLSELFPGLTRKAAKSGKMVVEGISNYNPQSF